ncbi:hypothetical protein D3C81_1145420 [compost metagenome]
MPIADRIKANDFLADPAFDHLLQTIKRAAANEQNIRRIDLDKFLMRMFTSALRRNGSDRTFQNFQQRLLHAFAGNVAGNRRILRFTRHFIDFVDVNDAAFRFFHIIISSLNQLQEDILDVFADIAGFGQGSRICDRERYIQDFRHRLGKEGFPRTRRTEQQNVTLLQLDILDLALRVHPLVVVVNRNGQRFLRLLLADDVLVQNIADFLGLRNFLEIQFFLVAKLFFHDFRAQLNAFVAYINAGSGNKLAYLFLRFAAERAFQLSFFIVKLKHVNTPL